MANDVNREFIDRHHDDLLQFINRIAAWQSALTVTVVALFIFSIWLYYNNNVIVGALAATAAMLIFVLVRPLLVRWQIKRLQVNQSDLADWLSGQFKSKHYNRFWHDLLLIMKTSGAD